VVNAPSSAVDVLIVVDNSLSMEFEQSNMSARFSSFLDKLVNLNWQLGIVTTDVRTDSDYSYYKDGRLLQFSSLGRNIIRSTDNPTTAALAFAETIQRKEIGSGKEQGVKATYRALERALNGGSNTGLIRTGAALSVILVTDSDETVLNNDFAGDVSTFGDKNHPGNLLNFVQTRMPGKIFKFNSIIVRDGDYDCLTFSGSGNEIYGRNYQKMTNMTSGILGSVCESDYSGQLSIIGDATSENIKVVPLDCSPIDSDNNGTVDLVIKDGSNNILSNYNLSGRTVTFNAVLPVGTYSFEYKCSVPQ
jgi:hypothetical protein